MWHGKSLIDNPENSTNNIILLPIFYSLPLKEYKERRLQYKFRQDLLCQKTMKKEDREKTYRDIACNCEVVPPKTLELLSRSNTKGRNITKTSPDKNSSMISKPTKRADNTKKTGKRRARSRGKWRRILWQLWSLLQKHWAEQVEVEPLRTERSPQYFSKSTRC